MRKLGIYLVTIGIAILGFYLIYNKSIDARNNEDMNKYIEETSIVNEQPEEIVKTDQSENTTKENYNITYTAILEIPKISLKRGVVDSTKNFKSINYAISVDNSSQYPNENGNFILYSHSGNSNIAFFNRLNNLELNDDIYVYYNGIKYRYSVRNKYDIEKTGKAKVISRKDDKYITLITCDQNKKGFQIVIEGKLVDEVNY